MDIPIVADTNHALARAFGCLKEDEGIAYRGLYIIDNKGQMGFQGFDTRDQVSTFSVKFFRFQHLLYDEFYYRIKV